jgi:DNA alkylation damage repair protein AlkB
MSMVGLLIFPSLLNEDVQLALLDKILHRDLANPSHKTNVHLFHHLVYPDAIASATGNSDSFFEVNKQHELQPRDPQVHKPMTIGRMLERKLRWMTLGGQYDWTAKVYPDEEHPQFPQDVARLLKAFFPKVDAEAAIVNFYCPGDTLSVHRDVSEDCNQGLISLSIGCDAIFLIGNEDDNSHVTVRLRSGDALLMSGEARFAWHAVPKIIPNTCPTWLQSWPGTESDNRYKQWEGWMKSKRININVRQMQERTDRQT